MKGVLDIYSEINNGTVFKLYFPSGDEKQKFVQPTDVKEVIGREEAILVVDDEKLVLNLVSKMLTRLNYKVYTATSGEMALDTYRELYDEISLIILDISMPEMSGKKCIQGLLEINPDAKVLFSSGHDLAADSEELKKLGCSGLIQKPYSLTDLGKRINKILN